MTIVLNHVFYSVVIENYVFFSLRKHYILRLSGKSRAGTVSSVWLWVHLSPLLIQHFWRFYQFENHYFMMVCKIAEGVSYRFLLFFFVVCFFFVKIHFWLFMEGSYNFQKDFMSVSQWLSFTLQGIFLKIGEKPLPDQFGELMRDFLFKSVFFSRFKKFKTFEQWSFVLHRYFLQHLPVFGKT